MDPVVVTIPHRHGKAEATRRIKAGIEDVRARYPAGGYASVWIRRCSER